MASDICMCPGVESSSKNDYQDNPGGKGGRCVRLTTYHIHVPIFKNLWSLNSRNSVGLFRPVMGQLFYIILLIDKTLNRKSPTVILCQLVIFIRGLKILNLFVVNEIMWKKYCIVRQLPDDNIAHGHCILGT